MAKLIMLWQLACFPNADNGDPAGLYIYRAPLDNLEQFEWYALMVWPQTVFDLPPDGDQYCYKCEAHYRDDPGPGNWRTELTPVDRDCTQRIGCHQ